MSFGKSLDDRVPRTLSFFKESADGGMLTQVWVSIKHGDEFILSTCEQPYMLDPKLEGNCEVSRTYTFSAKRKPGSYMGLPTRVFISMLLNGPPMLVTTIKLNTQVPCAVLELVTTKERPNFDRELEIVSHAVQVFAKTRTFFLPVDLPPS
ncbi:hypothetical protein VNO77_15401 [Canavalia gladiata]|uniref:Uncharacterized protein n=1 Tax=Canavalia gladiata TaxID=3824 RepID=A0AAN9QSC8_CANGL